MRGFDFERFRLGSSDDVSVEALLIGEQQGLVERRIEPNGLISWHTLRPLYLVNGLLVPQEDEMPDEDY